MSDLPTVQDYPLSIITTASSQAVGIELAGFAGNTFSGTAVWPTANKAFYIPIRVGFPFIVNNVFWVNGATVGTNSVDVGVYDSQGNQIVHTGNTLTSGVSLIQKVSISATTLQQGLYYLGMSVNGTTDTFLRDTGGAAFNSAVGILHQLTANPLPSPAVFAISPVAYVPLVGLTSNSVL